MTETRPTLIVTSAADLSDAAVDAEAALRSALFAETHPEQTPIPEATFATLIRSEAADRQRHCLVADAAGLAAYGVLTHVAGQPVADLEIGVRDDRRRRGHATAVAHRLIDSLPAGVGVVRGTTSDAAPAAEPFAISLGATVGIREHVNTLDLGAVDRARFRGWVDDAERSQPDYALDLIDGVWPEDRAADLCDLFAALDEAPSDDMVVGHSASVPPDAMRREQRAAIEMGIHLWTVVATHRRSGVPVGLHQVTWISPAAESVWVPNTVVRTAHRGHGLGRWMKAYTTLRVLDAVPAARRMETRNADSNTHMVRVNTEMGYRPLRGTATWQLVIAEPRRA